MLTQRQLAVFIAIAHAASHASDFLPEMNVIGQAMLKNVKMDPHEVRRQLRELKKLGYFTEHRSDGFQLVLFTHTKGIPLAHELGFNFHRDW